MRVVALSCLVVLMVLGHTGAGAQIVPLAVGTVQVTPDGGPALVEATSATNALAVFQVKNNFDTAQEYDLTCSRTGRVSSCYIDLETLSLDPYETVQVNVYYNTSSTAGSGTLTLRADGIAWNTGYHTVSVVAPVAPTVALVNASSDHWDRGDCLVLGAGEAALQCGDLLVAHGLPATRRLGTDRAPTLVYSSRQAAPKFVVAAHVTQPSGKPVPSQVKVRLLRAGVALDSTTYAGSSWTAGSTRQVVIAAADTVATGAWALTLEVQNLQGGTALSTTQAVTLPIVDRRASAFGRGWWLAGYERLVLNQPGGSGTGLLWVGADGSAALYAQVNATTWQAPLGAFRDSIVWQADSSRYRRRLRHGVEVYYDVVGRHIETRDRLGHRTTFTHDGSGRLAQISVPPQGVAGTTFTLAYNGSGRLTQMADPAGRVLAVTDSAGSISRITDPDSVVTRFGYNSAGQMTRRQGRGGSTVRYAYAKGLRVTEVRVPYGPTGADTAVTAITPWDERGLGGGPLVAPALASTEVLGPRVGVADDARFWVDRWGAPVTIVNALGDTTRIARGATAHPALVTRVTHPDGRVDSLTYTARGNLLTERILTSGVAGGALPDRVTTYAYTDPNAVDSPSRVTDGLGRHTDYAYGSLGLLTTMTDPAGHQTTFSYHASGSLTGRVQTATEQAVETWLEGGTDTGDATTNLATSFTYDALGNLRTTVGPTGARTYVEADAAGRPTYTVDHYGRAQRWTYTALNATRRHVRYTGSSAHPDGVNPATGCLTARVTCTNSYLAPDAALGDSLVTTWHHGPVGLDSVTDPRGNTRSWRYDARGLLFQDLDEYDQAREYAYDAAGALIRSISRLSTLPPPQPRDTVWVHRDALGRDTATVFTEAGIAPSEVIPGDTIRTEYDLMGRVVRRWSLEAMAQMEYRYAWYGDGSLKRQITAFVPGSGGDTLRYSYDASGAVTGTARSLGSVRDSTTYVYHGTTGRLTSLTAHWGAPLNQSRTLQVTWDALGRRRELAYPNQVNVKYRYGAEGTLRRVVAVNSHPGRVSHFDNFSFTRRLLGVDAVGQAHDEELVCSGATPSGDNIAGLCGATNVSRTITSTFDRLGQLVAQDPGTGTDEEYRYDKAGNLVYRRSGLEAHFFLMKPASNQLRVDSLAGTSSNATSRYYYTPDGALAEERTHADSVVLRRLYYDGLGRAVGIQDVGGDNGVGPTRFRCSVYGPSAWLIQPCASAAESPPWLVYDGANVGATLGERWVFVHGTGLDDPVMGLHRPSTPVGTATEYYWITDGAGRHLAAGTANGALSAAGPQGQHYQLRGGRFVGTTQAATGYHADRQTTASAPTLSMFRNRIYDQQTGRWAQEDPIGIAGGLNLYQFNGSNPVAYTDPFGLCPACLVFALRVAPYAFTAVKFVVEALDPNLDAGTTVVQTGRRVVSRAANAAQEAAAGLGRSWTTQRRAFWKAEAAAEGAADRWGAANVERMKTGKAAQYVDEAGQVRSYELHHTPTPRREGGIQVEVVTRAEHQAQDPYRR